LGRAFYFENEGRPEMAAATYDEIRLLWREGEDRHLALSGLLFAAAFYADNGRPPDTADCLDILHTIAQDNNNPESRATLRAVAAEGARAEGDTAKRLTNFSAYSRFHDVMAEDRGQNIVAALLDHILPLVPGLTLALRNGISVLDIGCGRGRALHLLAEEFPDSRFTGCDLSEEAIAYARDHANRSELRNLRFEVRDLTAFHYEAPEAAYDLVAAFDAIHDQARPDNVLAGIRRSLKPGGVFLMQDIRAASTIAENRDHPIGTLLYTISCMHCMTTSLAQGGMGLGAMWGEQKALEFLKSAGFANVEVRTLEHDIQNNHYVAWQAA
jgi:SAM-dependent methyltransferase